MARPVRTVALNALFLAPGESSGTETYLRGLAPTLARRFEGTRFTLVTTRRGGAALRREGWEELMEIVVLPCDEGDRAARTVAEQVLLPNLARRRRFDVVHSLASVAPIRVPGTAVITLHDATFFRMRTFNRVTTFGMRQVVSRAARNADGLIAVSVAARDEIRETLGLELRRFTVVPNGAGRPPAVGPVAPAALRGRLGVDGRTVVLCVAAKRPHKNQEVLVRAAARLPDHVAVVLAGHAEPYEDDLRSLARSLGVEDRVRFVGYLTDAELEGAWSLAGCAVFPTLAEGFGLPVLEAMRREVPVACSDIPVLHEVGGDVPRYFDPRDPRSAAEAIAAALDDRSRVEAGRRRAATFTWEASADGTFAAYERARA